MNQSTAILNEVKKAVSGKDQILLWVLAAILANGNILLEDIPGVGKTTVAMAFSKALGLSCNRVQFTPDVLPSDITGFSIYKKETGTMEYQPGAVLCNLFLADELNRATSRTQSALLEAMEEGRVTVDGNTYTIPRPFHVFATQNPTGASGTQKLPDSQMDRFMIRLSIGYPSPEAEREMVLRRLDGNPLEKVQQVVTREELLKMQAEVSSVFVKDEVIDYIISLTSATRSLPSVAQGASPRATLAVTAMSRAVAWLQDRDYVLPADVRTVFDKTVAHRLLLSAEAEAKGIQPVQILNAVLKQVPAPKV